MSRTQSTTESQTHLASNLNELNQSKMNELNNLISNRDKLHCHHPPLPISRVPPTHTPTHKPPHTLIYIIIIVRVRGGGGGRCPVRGVSLRNCYFMIFAVSTHYMYVQLYLVVRKHCSYVSFYFSPSHHFHG